MRPLCTTVVLLVLVAAASVRASAADDESYSYSEAPEPPPPSSPPPPPPRPPRHLCKSRLCTNTCPRLPSLLQTATATTAARTRRSITASSGPIALIAAHASAWHASQQLRAHRTDCHLRLHLLLHIRPPGSAPTPSAPMAPPHVCTSAVLAGWTSRAPSTPLASAPTSTRASCMRGTHPSPSGSIARQTWWQCAQRWPQPGRWWRTAVDGGRHPARRGGSTRRPETPRDIRIACTAEPRLSQGDAGGRDLL